MSNRGILAAAFFLFMGLICVAASGDEPDRKVAPEKTAEPVPGRVTVAVPKITTPQPDLAGQLGSVQNALQRLFTIPRATTRPATGSDPAALGNVHNHAIRDGSSSVPTGGRLLPHNLGWQYRGAPGHARPGDPTDNGLRPGVVVENDTDDDSGLAPVRHARLASIYESGVAAGLGYYHTGSPLTQSEQEWVNRRYYDGPPSRYGHDLGDRFRGYESDIYRYGFVRGYDAARFYERADARTEKLLAKAQSQLERGLYYFRQGRYHQAVRSFKLAAESDQGDPAARLYAAHALFATGRYTDAVAYLRRAFELQPKVAYLDFDIRDAYGIKADFDEQVADLEAALKHFPRNMDRLITLGYVHYFSNRPAGAYEALSKAHEVDPSDRLVVRLLENCKPPDVLLDPPARAEEGEKERKSD